MALGQETPDTPATAEETAETSVDEPTEEPADLAPADPEAAPSNAENTPAETESAAEPAAEPANETQPAGETMADPPADPEAESTPPVSEPTGDSVPAAEGAPADGSQTPAEEAVDDEASFLDMAKIVAMMLGLFILPMVVGNFIANSLRMPDYGWKIAVVIFALAAAVLALLTKEFKGGPDLSGGITLVYELVSTEEAGSGGEENGRQRGSNVKLGDVISALKRRIDPAGTREVVIRSQGPAIEVIIPETGQEELEWVKRMFTEMGNLEFRITADSRRSQDQRYIEPALKMPPEQKILTLNGRKAAEWVAIDTDEFTEDVDDPERIGLVKRRALGRVEALVLIDPMNVTGDYLTDAATGTGELGNPIVEFRFDAEGARRFGDLTQANLPTGDQYRFLGIILDKRLISAPSINSRITSNGQISGAGMTEREVNHIVEILNAGKLPAELSQEPISATVTSPTLGKETIRKGAIAIVGSLIAVLIFMLIYYRFAGFVACLALIANLILTVGTLYLIGAHFTLPGLAGLVLTIGMSVDANVLIFERIREELERGAALRMAIRNGFARASTTIIDSNLTTLITGFVLYALGTDQLRGFAITLIVGIVMSMFTAIFCSRILFDIAERKHWITRLGMMRILSHTNFNFIALRTPAVVASLVAIAIGMAAVWHRGSDMLDIDFTGGTSVTMVLKKGSILTFADVQKRIVEKTDLDDFNFQLVERQSLELEGETQKSFTVDTSIDSVEQVEQALEDAFKGELETYSVKVSGVKPYTQGESTGTEATLVFGTEGNPDAGISYDALQTRLKDALKAEGREGLDPVLLSPEYMADSVKRIVEWQVRLGAVPVESGQALLENLASNMSSEPVFPLASSIGGRVADDLKFKAFSATFVSLLGVMGYIWLRFQNFAFSLAAVVALVHDVLVTLGCLAISAYIVNAVPGFASALQIDAFQIGLSVLAAILTLIGYSLNDTIVTFDRIREVRGKSPGLTDDMINVAINQTLSRTLLTFLTTFIVVGILFAYGGAGIHAFSFTLLVGLIAGTYSSIFIAAPILLWITGDANNGKK